MGRSSVDLVVVDGIVDWDGDKKGKPPFP